MEKQKMTEREIDSLFSEVARELHGEMDRKLEKINGKLNGGAPSMREVFDRGGFSSEKPLPAIVDGHPLVDSVLKDGRFVYVAADKDGKPLKDSDGKHVVIDPQTGDLRYRMKNIKTANSIAPEAPLDERTLWLRMGQNPNRLPLPNDNGLTRSVAQLGQSVNSNPEFLEMLSKVPRIEPTKPKRRIKTAWTYIKAIGIVIKLFFLVKILRREIPINRKVTFDLNSINKYLSDKAKLLVNEKHDEEIYEGQGRYVAFPRMIAMRVRRSLVQETLSLNSIVKNTIVGDLALAEDYSRRWANMLNDLAEKGIWVYGVQTPPSIMLNPIIDLSTSATIFARIYTPMMDEDNSYDSTTPIKALNAKVGFDVFVSDDGAMPINSDWIGFPW